MHVDSLIQTASCSLQSLAPSLQSILLDKKVIDITRKANAKGFFSPEDDDQLQFWFARYLTTRRGLLETIQELRPLAMPGGAKVEDHDRVRAFL
ncbi:MAG: hypothetical protein O7G85_00175, partial [Planctomycetota bacterium]|nr:hypothetical protein [Planctomycetota bacterium]